MSLLKGHTAEFTQTPLYLLLAFFWWAPRLIHQVEERVEVGRVELPIIRTAKKQVR